MSLTVSPETEVFARDLSLLIELCQESHALSRDLQQDAFLSTQLAKAISVEATRVRQKARPELGGRPIAGVQFSLEVEFRWVTSAKRGVIMPKPDKESSPIGSGLVTAEGRPTREEIELRAFQIYTERGGAGGQDLEDWLQAERELLEKYGRTGRMAKAKTN